MMTPERSRSQKSCHNVRSSSPRYLEALPLSWIDKLESHGRKAAKEKRPAKPKPVVCQVIVTTRPSDPDSGDPGSARIGYYVVEGDLLTLCDENGTPIKTDRDEMITAVLEHPSDAHAVASVLTRKRSRGSGMRGFEKGALKYPPAGWR